MFLMLFLLLLLLLLLSCFLMQMQRRRWQLASFWLIICCCCIPQRSEEEEKWLATTAMASLFLTIICSYCIPPHGDAEEKWLSMVLTVSCLCTCCFHVCIPSMQWGEGQVAGDGYGKFYWLVVCFAWFWKGMEEEKRWTMVAMTIFLPPFCFLHLLHFVMQSRKRKSSWQHMDMASVTNCNKGGISAQWWQQHASYSLVVCCLHSIQWGSRQVAGKDGHSFAWFWNVMEEEKRWTMMAMLRFLPPLYFLCFVAFVMQLSCSKCNGGG